MATKEKKILLPDDPPTGTGVQGEQKSIVGTTNSDGETIQNEAGDFSIRDNKNLWSRALQNVDDTAIQGVINDVQQSSGRPTRELGMYDPVSRNIEDISAKAEASRNLQQQAQEQAQKNADEEESIATRLKKIFSIESDAERAAREKNERRAKLFASIGDGISALSDMYFSTQGAPMVHDPASGMSERLRQRYEKLDAERKANEAAYQHEYLRQLEQMQRAKKEAAAAALEEKKFKLAEDREARMQEQSNLQSRKFDWQQKYQQGLLDIKQEEAQIRRDLADGLISKREAETALIELRKYRLQNTPTKGSNTGGGSSNNGGRNRRQPNNRGGNTGRGNSNSSGNRGGVGAGNNTRRLFNGSRS